MNIMTVLVIVGLVMCCGAVTRLLAGMGASHHHVSSRSDRSVDALDDRFAALSEEHRQAEGELEERMLELEERLDFTERMLANANVRGVRKTG